MRRRTTQLSLLFILILTLGAIIVVWPSNPKRYLPDFLPWPVEDCVGPICVGKGVRLPFIDITGSTVKISHIERNEMKLGLDLQGGTRLVLEADISNQPDVNLNEALDTAVQVVERRVNAFGVAESITERVGSDRISVQLPGISAEDAISKIGRTAQLQFMELSMAADGGVNVKEPDGTLSTEPLNNVLATREFENVRGAAEPGVSVVWKPVTAVDKDGVTQEITGKYLDTSKIFVAADATGLLPELRFGMNSTGAALLEQATTRLEGLPMAFFLDGEPIRGADGRPIAPTVQSAISDSGRITGLTASDANTLSTLLRTGAFPVPLRVVQQEDVDATLGGDAVVKSVQAGLIAIAMVMAFMTFYYRLPGFLASLALFVYVSLTLAVYKLFPVTITSAGMAAFVLSVGMAVDANILIFERMKEELRIGRSLVNAIEAGSRRAWTSIRDSNVATLITCLILYWFGDHFAASLVKGFALTLALGVVVSMFSAIFVTQTFLRSLIGSPVMRHLWLFGDDVSEARAALVPAAGPVSAASGPRSREE